jgi:hypothetical protein
MGKMNRRDMGKLYVRDVKDMIFLTIAAVCLRLAGFPPDEIKDHRRRDVF